MMNGKYRLTTLGCKVNQYESQLLRQTLEAAGFSQAARGEPHDIAVVNTCAVTLEASRKSRQSIRKLSRRGTTPVVVVGCDASVEPERIRQIKGVIAVAGHDSDAVAALRECLANVSDNRPRRQDTRLRGPVLSDPRSQSRSPAEPSNSTGEAESNPGGPERSHEVENFDIEEHQATAGNESADQLLTLTIEGRSADLFSIPASLPIVNTIDELPGRIDSFAGHQRAFLKIQDGCDAFCTYCIIPQLRPRLRSKSIESAVAEAEALVRAGHREIVLTGIFLGAYGRETALRRRWGATCVSPLARVVDALANIEGLDRLRLSSLEPGDIDGDLLAVVGAHENCVPHFHLPLQSGSAEILRRMNRQYTRSDYLRMIDQVRGALDQPAISTDIIVGFPGETDDDFFDSIEIARYAEFCKIHAFPFSPRAKTAAAKWTGDFVPPSIVKQRMDQLRVIEQETAFAYRRRLIGRHERIIVETITDDGIATGHADRYIEVSVPARDANKGDLLHITITKATPGRTHAIRSSCDQGAAETAIAFATTASTK